MYREFWRVWVPQLLAPRHGTTSVDTLTSREEAEVQSVLISSLEQFICGSENVDAIWQKLSACDAPSTVCGHVFKHGETCYNCKWVVINSRFILAFFWNLPDKTCPNNRNISLDLTLIHSSHHKNITQKCSIYVFEL